MNTYKDHSCDHHCSDVSIEYSDEYLDGSYTWLLIIRWESNKKDLECNHHLEEVGEEIWSNSIVGILNSFTSACFMLMGMTLIMRINSNKRK